MRRTKTLAFWAVLLLLIALVAERYEVINAGQSGATTADSLVKLALIHVDLKPDFVIVYHGTNDVAPSYGIGFRSDYAHRKKDIGATPYPVFDRLPRRLEYSSLFVAIRCALCREHGARLVLGTFVYSRDLAEGEQGPEWADAWERCIDLQNESIRTLAEERPEILLADQARSVSPDGSHRIDHCHFTPQGNRAVARVFLDAIRPALHALDVPAAEDSRR